MADNWDDDDYKAPDLKVVSEYGEEVIRKLDEDEVKKQAEAAAAAAASQQQAKEKSKKQKGKEKSDKEPSVEAGEGKQLTPQELENIQRAADLAVAAETFGVGLSNSSSEDNIDRFQPQSKEEFETFLKYLSSKIGSYQKSEHYYDFLSSLFTDLCVKLDSEHIRRYGKEISALGAEKLKEEKEKQKQKSKKKPTLVSKKAATGDLDDVVGEGGYNDFGGDDEDFM